MNLKKKRVIQQYSMSIPMRYAIGLIVLLSGITLLLHFGDRGSVGSAFDAATFVKTATSGVMVIQGDTQVLATSSERVYAIFCNDGGQVLYLSLDEDAPIVDRSGIRLNTGNCFEINELNLYQGAVRASSTDETASNLFIGEYK